MVEWLILAIAVAVAIWCWQRSNARHVARPLMTPEERQCEQDLRTLMGDGVTLHSKVHLACLLPHRHCARTRTLDFLISHSATHQPLVAVTLQDSSRLKRLCREAKLPLLNARQGIDTALLSTLLPPSQQASVTPHGHLTDDERDSLFEAIQSLNETPAKQS
ncbi:hypothetical protein [Ferrimonas balearica]|nr:hypothetical protein [Ferrimonas balearica]MBY5994636.1 hypothetical protein [Ferrimonas balearica]